MRFVIRVHSNYEISWGMVTITAFAVSAIVKATFIPNTSFNIKTKANSMPTSWKWLSHEKKYWILKELQDNQKL